MAKRKMVVRAAAMTPAAAEAHQRVVGRAVSLDDVAHVRRIAAGLRELHAGATWLWRAVPDALPGRRHVSADDQAALQQLVVWLDAVRGMSLVWASWMAGMLAALEAAEAGNAER